MFVSPFTVSIVCDAAIIVLFLQRPKEFGGSPWFGILDGSGFSEELVDVVWLAMIRIAFLLPHVLGFLKRRRLSCPGFHHTFVVANFFFVGIKTLWIILSLPNSQVSLLWWLLLALSAVSIVAQRGCLHHLRSSMPTPRYKTIFIGSRLDARLLGDQYDSGTSSEDDDFDDDDNEYSSAEEFGRRVDLESSGSGGAADTRARGSGGGGSEEAKGSLGRVTGAGRNRTPKSKGERHRSLSRTATPGAGKRRKARRRRRRSRSRSSRQESTRELVDFFAHRMQEARDAWSARVSALQKRWQASFLSGDAWGMRGGGSVAADRDAALRLTFGLIVRMYAYENTLEDLRLAAEDDPECLEAFAPQFASFLVWDSYYMSGQVQAWLLERCSENLYFAHALEFQLRASCLPASSSSPTAAAAPGPAGIGGAAAAAAASSSSSPPGRPFGRRSSSTGSRRNSSSGGSSSSDLRKSVLEGAGLVGDGSDGGGGSGGGGSDGGGGVDRLARRAVELLLKDIAESGERAARRLIAGGQADAHGGAAARAEDDVDEGNGSYGSMRTTPTMAAVAGAGEQGEAATTHGDQARTAGEGDKQPPFLYRQTLDFLGSLADIASSLTPLSKTERTPLLKERLGQVGKEFLGSGATSAGISGNSSSERLVYVPVGDRHHRIVAVHPSESFAFSTRERAPCFVCLEVIGAKEPPVVGQRRRGRRRRRRQSDAEDAEDATGQQHGEDEQVGESAGRGNLLSRRMQALRQWLPRGVSFRQKRFRFRGAGAGAGGTEGKGWALSLGDAEDAAELGMAPQGGDEEEEENRGIIPSGTRRASPSPSVNVDQSGASGGGSLDTSRLVAAADSSSRGPRMKDGRSRSSGGIIGVGGGSGSVGTGARGYDPDDDHYRLLMEEGGSRGGGAAPPLSDAREWWTESSSGTGRPWGGEDDVGDDALADVPERRQRLSKASSSPPPARDSAVASYSRKMDAAATTMDRGGGGDRGRGVCGKCGAESGRPCRPGCRASSEPDSAGGGGGGDGGAPRPQVLFNELWGDKSNRIRRVSPWADEPGWRLLPVIVKSNDDLRQEQLASQLLFVMQRILRAEGVRVWLRPYDIVALSADSGIIEAVPDTISLDALRRYRAGADGGENDPAASRFSLTGFFEARFGAKGSEGFRQAQRRFIESLAAYSIACYLLQIKDRHNGNILLDSQGRVIHIDFGFILANSPGGNLGFESAPFKLTQGFLNLMGGTQSRCFREFRGLCVDTFLALRRSSQEIVLLVEMMASGNESLPCFQGPGGGAAAAADLAARFQPELNDPACQDFVHKLVQQSAGSWTTAWYDKYQRFWSGIY